MPGNIKGVTIVFSGDTTKLQRAIRDVDKEIQKTAKELKSVDKALKFNPTSIELWRQKQQLLKQTIEQTEKKLKTLKDAQKQMVDSGVDKNSEEYRKLQREIIETESKLKHYKAELRKVGNVNLRAASEQFKKLGDNISKAGEAMRGFSTAGAAVVAMLGALAVKSGQWADDLNTMSKVYGISTDELQKYAASAELVDVDVQTIASSHVKLKKAMSGAEDETGAQADAFERLGISVTDADGNLRDADEVWNETIVALGKLENETERDALAMTLMGKSASELNPLIEDGGETYEKTAKIFEKYGLSFIDQDMLDRANEFNDSLSMIKAIGATAFQQIGTELAAYLAPLLEKVVDLVGRIAQWLTNLDPTLLAIIGAVGGFIALASPLLMGLGKIATGVGALIEVLGVIGPILTSLLTNPYVLVIGAVIAAGIALYKNWDKIKAKLIELWNRVKTIFANMKATIVNTWNNIKSAVTSAVNAVRDKVSSVFDSMKSKITSVTDSIKSIVRTAFEAVRGFITSPIETAVNLVRSAIDRIRQILSSPLSLPHIKLPHFRIVGHFSLNPPSVPHLGVDWYDKGGIFRSPTVIGVGEKRPEFVGALDDLRDIFREEAGFGGVTINVYPSSGMNANELAAEVERRLIASQKARRMAWQ